MDLHSQTIYLFQRFVRSSDSAFKASGSPSLLTLLLVFLFIVYLFIVALTSLPASPSLVSARISHNLGKIKDNSLFFSPRPVLSQKNQSSEKSHKRVLSAGCSLSLSNFRPFSAQMRKDPSNSNVSVKFHGKSTVGIHIKSLTRTPSVSLLNTAKVSKGGTPSLSETETRSLAKARNKDLNNKLASQEDRFIIICQRKCRDGKIILNAANVGVKCCAVLKEIICRNYTVHHLELKENSIGDEGVNILSYAVKKSKSLVHLDLSSNKITSAGAKILFEALSHNESIYCFIFRSTPGPNHNVIKPGGFKGMTKMIKENKTLGIIDISGNLAGNVGLKHIASGIEQNCSVISLCLSQTFINDGAADDIIQILKTSKVKYIDLSKNKLCNQMLEKLAQHFLRYTCTLHTLNLSHCGFMGNYCQLLFASLERGPLKTLIFDGNCVNAENSEAFAAAVHKLSNLRNLSLNFCVLTTDLIRSISTNLLKKSFLSHLHLQGNSINSEGAIAIANIFQTSNLISLDLSRNIIGDSGGVALANNLSKAVTLKELNLCWNELSDISGKAFEEICPELIKVETILLLNNKVSSAQLNKVSDVKQYRALKKHSKEKIITEYNKRKEYIQRFPTKIGNYEEIVREAEEVCKEGRQEEALYNQESKVFHDFLSKRRKMLDKEEEKVKKLDSIVAEINAKTEHFKSEGVKVKMKAENVINDKAKKAGHLKEYTKSLEDEIEKVKQMVNYQRTVYEDIISDLKDRLKIEQDKMESRRGLAREKEKMLNTSRYESSLTSFAELVSSKLNVKIDLNSARKKVSP